MWTKAWQQALPVALGRHWYFSSAKRPKLQKCICDSVVSLGKSSAALWRLVNVLLLRRSGTFPHRYHFVFSHIFFSHIFFALCSLRISLDAVVWQEAYPRIAEKCRFTETIHSIIHANQNNCKPGSSVKHTTSHLFQTVNLYYSTTSGTLCPTRGK